MANNLGIAPARFAAQLASNRAGKPMILATQRIQPFGEREPTGHFGKSVIEEAAAEHRAEIEGPGTDVQSLCQEASRSIDEYLAHADEKDSWKRLARVGALIAGALDRVVPAFASRINPHRDRPGSKQSQWL